MQWQRVLLSVAGMLLSLILLVAGGEAPASTAEAPKVELVCRYESVVSRLLVRRKLCLTPDEWAERDRNANEAARRSLYEPMGNTACLDGGLCTIE